MRRRTFDMLVSSTGMVLTIVLLVAGGLLFWGYSFANSNVHDQLAAQKIFFPPKGSEALAPPEVGRYLNQYAGQQLVNGAQAQAYANHFIAKPQRRETGWAGADLVQGRDASRAAPQRLRLLEDRTDRTGGEHRLVRPRRAHVGADDPGVLAPAPRVFDPGAHGSQRRLGEDPRARLRACDHPPRQAPDPPARPTGGPGRCGLCAVSSRDGGPRSASLRDLQGFGSSRVGADEVGDFRAHPFFGSEQQMRESCGGSAGSALRRSPVPLCGRGIGERT